MIEGVVTLYGRIDFLVCNAGGAWETQDVTEITQEHWRSVIKAEVDGLFYCIKHTLPQMREAHFGRIIAVGFGGAEHSVDPPHDYVTGKVMRHAFIRSLATREIVNGITCNVIAPSHTMRPTMKQAIDAVKHNPTWRRRTSATPQDGAEVARFLCSDEAAFVTGNVITITAGNN